MNNFAVVDCDNCYVSCEIVFRPDLNGRQDSFMPKSWASAPASMSWRNADPPSRLFERTPYKQSAMLCSKSPETYNLKRRYIEHS